MTHRRQCSCNQTISLKLTSLHPKHAKQCHFLWTWTEIKHKHTRTQNSQSALLHVVSLFHNLKETVCTYMYTPVTTLLLWFVAVAVANPWISSWNTPSAVALYNKPQSTFNAAKPIQRDISDGLQKIDVSCTTWLQMFACNISDGRREGISNHFLVLPKSAPIAVINVVCPNYFL